MKDLVKYLRFGTVGIILTVGILIIVSEPSFDIQNWMLVFFVSKLLGFVILGLGCLLVRRWEPKNKFPEIFYKLLDED